MASETQNYGYPKPDAEDFYNVEDFNRAMDMVDGDVKGLQDAVSALREEKADGTELRGHMAAANPHGITKEKLGLGNVPNVATNDQAPTFSQAASRGNINSGEKMSVIFGKIKKYFADLKTVAFTGSYNDLTNRPSIPAAVRVKGGAESAYRTGDVNLTKVNIGLGNVDNTADANKSVDKAQILAVRPTNYKQGTDLPSAYPQGAYIFFSSNPANKFNGFSYGTVHTIKGYTNMACIQFLYPYNTNHDRFYFREALYNSDSWRSWHEVVTSANISSQSVASAVKATQDSAGNVIKDNYAVKKLINGGDFNNMTTPGLYTMKACSQNAPSSSNYHGLLVLQSDTGNYIEQIAYQESSFRVFIRYLSSSSWSKWEQLIVAGDLVNKIYPVGSIYLSINATNPASLFGGTWEQWGSGRVPVGVDTSQAEFNVAGKAGGFKTHTLTAYEIPAHAHVVPQFSGTTGTGGSHTHGARYDKDAATGTGKGRYFPAGTTEKGNFTTSSGSHNHTFVVGQRNTYNTGGSLAHNNLQPYITCYMWRRTA